LGGVIQRPAPLRHWCNQEARRKENEIIGDVMSHRDLGRLD
jgi:hypothetical protein